jgi:hypothetical protein
MGDPGARRKVGFPKRLWCWGVGVQEEELPAQPMLCAVGSSLLPVHTQTHLSKVGPLCSAT